MTITAKYASRCASCSQPVTPGATIEWSKGAPVRHSSCTPVQARGSSSTGAHGRATRTRTGCSCGSVEEYSRDSDCQSCRFDQDD